MELGLREWGAHELRAGLFAGMLPYGRASREASLADWFSSHFAAPALPLNSGSSALQLALECLAARQPQRRRVLLPALACPALSRVLRRCGLQPHYVDIAGDLNTTAEALAREMCPQTLAVIMVHAYGHAADSAAIQRLCRQHGVALIDDAAQRIEPKSGLGTCGDFGIFSFAQSKNVVTGIDGSGGILLVHERAYLPELSRRWQQLPVAEGRRAAWLEFLLQGRSPRLAYYLSRWRNRSRKAGEGPGLRRIAAIDAVIALTQLESLQARRAERLRLLEAWRQELEAAGIEAPQLTGSGVPSYLARLMVRVPPSQRDACRKALAAQGIASRLPYRLPDDLPAHSCTQARRSAAELLELPLPARWQAADLRIAAQRLAGLRKTTISTMSEDGALACNTTGN